MNAIREILEKDYTALEKGLAISCVLMLGILLGFVFSPIKKGIMLGSKNGCNNHYNSGGNHAALKKDKKRCKK